MLASAYARTVTVPTARALSFPLSSISANSFPLIISYLTAVLTGLCLSALEATALSASVFPTAAEVILLVNSTMSAPSPTVTVQVAVFPPPVLAVIFAVPFESAVTTPFSSTSAIS